MHPATKRNLLRALEGEALSAARLTAYAERAQRDGDPDAARTLRALARLDLAHADEILEQLGWVQDLRDNVLAQLVGDVTTHGIDYAAMAFEAQTAGDQRAAKLFRRLTADETEAAVELLGMLGERGAKPLAAGADSPTCGERTDLPAFAAGPGLPARDVTRHRSRRRSTAPRRPVAAAP